MKRALFALVLVSALVACDRAPTALHVQRVLVHTAVGQFEPLDRTITDVSVVADLDAVVRALPPAPYTPGAETFCPISWGLRYQLTFTHSSDPTLIATVEADGCRYAYLGPTDRRATTESFWAGLAAALGYYTRGNDLFPLPNDMRR